jgi:hypothetical protein
VYDNNIFIRDDTSKLWGEHGISLTTYNFRSSSGSHFQYIIQLFNEDINFDRHVNNEMEHDNSNITTSRRNKYIENMHYGNRSPSKLEASHLIMLMEISAAYYFNVRSNHFSSLKMSSTFIKFDVIMDHSLKEEFFSQPQYKVLCAGQTQYSKSKCMTNETFSILRRLFTLFIFLETVSYLVSFTKDSYLI